MNRITCKLCNSTNVSYQFRIEDLSIYQCNECELMFGEPKIQTTQVEGSSKKTIHTSIESRSWKKLKKNSVKQCISEFLNHKAKIGKKLLIAGWDSSEFLDEIQKTDMDITVLNGISELIDKYKTFTNIQVNMDSKNLLESQHDNQFDMVVAFNIIQNYADPFLILQKLKLLLKENGILYLVTPSLDSWSARLLKSNWFEFIPEHLYYFNTQNLESTLIKSGFYNVDTLEGNKLLYYDKDSFTHKKLRFPFYYFPAKMVSFFFPSIIDRINHKLLSSGISLIAQKSPNISLREKLSIIIPVYNEKTTFQTLIEIVRNKQIPNIDKEIIIVESNSVDGTKEEVQKYENIDGIKVVYEDRPRGKGHAVRTGLMHATGTILLIQDADLEYDVNDYDQLLKPILSYQKMFVLGSRHTGDWKMRDFADDRIMSHIFNLGQIIFTWMINVACDSKLKDPFTMYKVFRRECMYGLKFESNRFDFDWEIVIKFLRKKYFPLEVPVNYQSRSFSQGKKVSIIRDPILWMKALVKYRFIKLKDYE